MLARVLRIIGVIAAILFALWVVTLLFGIGGAVNERVWNGIHGLAGGSTAGTTTRDLSKAPPALRPVAGLTVDEDDPCDHEIDTSAPRKTQIQQAAQNANACRTAIREGQTAAALEREREHQSALDLDKQRREGQEWISEQRAIYRSSAPSSSPDIGATPAVVGK